MAAIQNWDNCSICQQILDGKPMGGTHDGLVALSKRCYHVFHKTCIEGWLEQGKRTCPNCDLKHFSVCEVVLNPENTRQYQKWLADPAGYSYEQAFIDECGHSHQEAGLPAEHILRPKELRGKDRREQLTRQEISQFYHEMNAALQRLPENATREQIDKARLEIVGAESMILDSIGNDFEDIRNGFAEIRQMSDRNRVKLAHEQLLTQYCRKTIALRDKVRAKSRELDRLPFSEEKNRLERELIAISTRITQFSQEFTENGRTNERSIAESRELLELVDSELDAFVAEQPEHIQEILTAAPPPAEENNEPWYQSTAVKILGFIACVFGIFAIRRYFLGDRSIKPQEEL